MSTTERAKTGPKTSRTSTRPVPVYLDQEERRMLEELCAKHRTSMAHELREGLRERYERSPKEA